MSGYSATAAVGIDLSGVSASGCGGLGAGATMSLSLNGTDWTAPAAFADTTALDLTDPAVGGTSGDGSRTVRVKVSDGIGSQSVLIATVVLDRADPTGSLQIDNGLTTTTSRTVTLDLGGISADGAGLWMARFSNDGGSTWSPWQSVWTFATWTLTSGAGGKTVSFQVVDRAGNMLSGDAGITLVTPDGSTALTISPVVSISGVPAVIDMGSGLPGDTVGPVEITTTITTNASGGYTLSVSASDLSPALGGTAIPATGFVVNGASPAASDTPLVVHTGPATTEGGDEVVVDIRLYIPFVVNGAYSGSMVFAVETGR
jgi:hypothetical protein